MTQRATIENYAQTVRIVKEMNIDEHQWKENDWKEEGRKAVLKAYARHSPDIDQMILGCFVFGRATRKVGEALLSVLGERISPSTGARVAKTLDKAVEAFHRQRLADKYKAIILDGAALTKKTGVGAIKKIVLAALGIRHDMRKEVIDFYITSSESEAGCPLDADRFLTNLDKRGLKGEGVEVRAVDGGKGLLAALKTVYPDIPTQRCWAHKIRTRPMGVFSDRTSMERILYAVFTYENKKEGTNTPFLLIQNN